MDRGETPPEGGGGNAGKQTGEEERVGGRRGVKKVNRVCKLCGMSLAGQRTYYQRYRCCAHCASKERVEINGQALRFCQQCGKFEDVALFDGLMRTCRDRLDRHAARRREAHARAKSEAMAEAAAARQRRSTKPPARLQEQGYGEPQQGGYVNRVPQQVQQQQPNYHDQHYQQQQQPSLASGSGFRTFPGATHGGASLAESFQNQLVRPQPVRFVEPPGSAPWRSAPALVNSYQASVQVQAAAGGLGLTDDAVSAAAALIVVAAAGGLPPRPPPPVDANTMLMQCMQLLMTAQGNVSSVPPPELPPLQSNLAAPPPPQEALQEVLPPPADLLAAVEALKVQLLAARGGGYASSSQEAATANGSEAEKGG